MVITIFLWGGPIGRIKDKVFDMKKGESTHFNIVFDEFIRWARIKLSSRLGT